MNNNRTNNINAILTIANALSEINERVVYVGGSVVSLYVNDPAAGEIRPTKDVDISLEIVSLGELEKLRVELSEKGFRQSAEESVLCRFLFKDIKIDVMARKEIGWAPANPWFEPGFSHLDKQKIENTTIQILSLPYFLASKFAAFQNRGIMEPRTSHDFEDIVYILDNRTDIVSALKSAPSDARSFLVSEFNKILKEELLQEAVLTNLEPPTQAQRFKLIREKLKEITKT